MIGRHAKRDVVVPARLAKLTEYVRGNVHLRLSIKSVQNRRDTKTRSWRDYLLHLQDRWSTLECVFVGSKAIALEIWRTMSAVSPVREIPMNVTGRRPDEGMVLINLRT